MLGTADVFNFIVFGGASERHRWMLWEPSRWVQGPACSLVVRRLDGCDSLTRRSNA
jgi:hypothetical protein